MYLIVNLDFQPERLARMVEQLGEVRRFPATPGSIPDTYRRLALAAPEGIVCQDDIRFVRSLDRRPVYRGSKLGRRHTPEIIVYGTLGRSGHICPKAFSATRSGWEALRQVWDGQAQTCRAWQPVVERYGVVLNVVEHEKPVGRHARLPRL